MRARARRRYAAVTALVGLIAVAASVVAVLLRNSGHGARSIGSAADQRGPAAVRIGHPPPSGSSPRAVGPRWPAWLASISPRTPGHLAPGSDPAALPGPLLIADRSNNRLLVVDPRGRIRWEFPRQGDLASGQTFRVPDDAFFTTDGRYIVATQEDDAVVTLISVAEQRIVYRYGLPGRPGMTANRVNNPDDAMLLPNGTIVTADIKNCRILLISKGAHRPLRSIGRTTNNCVHDPPLRWGSPNGVFSESNGRYLVTEINGDWVSEMNLDGTVSWSTHPPGVAYPSDSNQIGPNRYLTVDYSLPGQVVIFDRAGHLLWRYRGTPMHPLNHPSLALGLPNGDLALNDDFNHRVIVIDPRRNRIVWQYGVTGTGGNAPGYLNNPDGIDLLPPYSFLATHTADAR